MSSDKRFKSRWSMACRTDKCEECGSMSCEHHCYGQFTKDKK